MIKTTKNRTLCLLNIVKQNLTLGEVANPVTPIETAEVKPHSDHQYPSG